MVELALIQKQIKIQYLISDHMKSSKGHGEV